MIIFGLADTATVPVQPQAPPVSGKQAAPVSCLTLNS
jgi:hypothetical protein